MNADPIRLLYLRDTLALCGPGKTIINTWRTLDRDRFALTIASTRPHGGGRNDLLERARALDAPTVPFEIGRGADLAGMWRLVRLLRSGRYDILQTHDAQTRRLGVVAARLAGVLHVTSVHGWIFNTSKERAARWLDAKMIGLADHVITISAQLKREVVAHGAREDRITVLPNAILMDDYAQTGEAPSVLRQELGIPADHAVVSIIGRLSPEKGHDVFLAAARTLARKHRSLTFLIVGDGPTRAALESAVDKAGLVGRVLFTGHRPDMALVYDATTIVVSSSYTEGIPNVLLEAFAHGRPAVATQVGGVPEIMSDGVEGWLVPPGQSAVLADRVDAILCDRSALAMMGQRARRAIDERFDFRHRTRSLEQLYETVVIRRATATAGAA